MHLPSIQYIMEKKKKYECFRKFSKCKRTRYVFVFTEGFVKALKPDRDFRTVEMQLRNNVTNIKERNMQRLLLCKRDRWEYLERNYWTLFRGLRTKTRDRPTSFRWKITEPYPANVKPSGGYVCGRCYLQRGNRMHTVFLSAFYISRSCYMRLYGEWKYFWIVTSVKAIITGCVRIIYHWTQSTSKSLLEIYVGEFILKKFSKERSRLVWASDKLGWLVRYLIKKNASVKY